MKQTMEGLIAAMAPVYEFVGAGMAVGFLIGLTGVGGGSLMTPMLLVLGIPMPIAIGTDLFYASFTKVGGAFLHWREKHVDFRLLLLLASGSIPASLATSWMLSTQIKASTAAHLMHFTLSLMLVFTGISLILKRKMQQRTSHAGSFEVTSHRLALTWITGTLLGIVVTLSSVGAGALGVVVLMALYPRLKLLHVVGTDVAHAVLLTMIAGFGHMKAGHVDGHLLLALCAGSLPALYAGMRLSLRAPDQVLRLILGSTLLILGGKFVFF